MKSNQTLNKHVSANVRWPFRLILLLAFCFLFYIGIERIFNNFHNTNIFLSIIFLLYFTFLFGFAYPIIVRNEASGYFFNYNFESTKLSKYLSKKSNKPKKQRNIYFETERIKFDEFIASKLMVQIWGLLDLLTLVIFWRYFYNNTILVHGVLNNDLIVKYSMIPHYMTALVSISLLFSGLLLIIPSKLGGRIVGVQMFIKMFAYLPSVFPLLWLMGFSIEHRYIKALVITTFCVEFIRVVTIHHYFKFDKNQNYFGYNQNS